MHSCESDILRIGFEVVDHPSEHRGKHRVGVGGVASEVDRHVEVVEADVVEPGGGEDGDGVVVVGVPERASDVRRRFGRRDVGDERVSECGNPPDDASAQDRRLAAMGRRP
jgi:hypothetical protein